eukprot:878374_1
MAAAPGTPVSLPHVDLKKYEFTEFPDCSPSAFTKMFEGTTSKAMREIGKCKLNSKCHSQTDLSSVLEGCKETTIGRGTDTSTSRKFKCKVHFYSKTAEGFRAICNPKKTVNRYDVE